MAANEDVVASSKVRTLEKRVHDLERLLGRKTLENEILKEALELARPKKPPLRLSSWRRGRFAMKAIADTLGVARSNLGRPGEAKR